MLPQVAHWMWPLFTRHPHVLYPVTSKVGANDAGGALDVADVHQTLKHTLYPF